MPGVKRKRRKVMGVAVGKEFWRVELNLFVWVRTSQLQFVIKFADQIIGTKLVHVNFIFGRSQSEAEAIEDDGVSGSGEFLPEESVVSQPPLIAK
jgi:hypothetical protein